METKELITQIEEFVRTFQKTAELINEEVIDSNQAAKVFSKMRPYINRGANCWPSLFISRFDEQDIFEITKIMSVERELVESILDTVTDSSVYISVIENEYNYKDYISIAKALDWIVVTAKAEFPQEVHFSGML